MFDVTTNPRACCRRSEPLKTQPRFQRTSNMIRRVVAFTSFGGAARLWREDQSCERVAVKTWKSVNGDWMFLLVLVALCFDGRPWIHFFYIMDLRPGIGKLRLYVDSFTINVRRTFRFLRFLPPLPHFKKTTFFGQPPPIEGSVTQHTHVQIFPQSGIYLSGLMFHVTGFCHWKWTPKLLSLDLEVSKRHQCWTAELNFLFSTSKANFILSPS